VIRLFWRTAVFCGLVTTASAAQADGLPPLPPSVLTSLPAFASFTKLRDDSISHGVQLSATYIGDLFGNPTGGMKQGVRYMGRLETDLDIDFEKLAGWKGLTFHTNAYQIHGEGFSRTVLGNIFTISNIEARSTTRLFELWAEQKLGDQVAVRVGQMGIDTEFLTSNTAGLFINGTFGWPGLPSVNLPSGGPAFPIATPGVRVKYTPTDSITLLGAVFNGDPSGPGTGDPELRNLNGTRFRLDTAPLLIGEAQYAYNQGKSDKFAGTLKLGGWLHTGGFPDQSQASNGLSYADPASTGVALNHSKNFSIYGVIDQQVYRLPGDDPTKGASLFVRVMGSPDDRNLMNFYADAGMAFSGMVPGRPDDIVGFGGAYGRIGDGARALDQAAVQFTGIPTPIRDYEASVELTYLYTVVPGFSIQPNLQYVWHPGGNVVNPLTPNSISPIRDAVVLGIRTTISF
jgi:porin